MAAVFRSASDFADVCSKEESVAFRFTANDLAHSFQWRELVTAGVKNREKFLSNVYSLINVELHASGAQVTANPFFLLV